PSVRAATLLAQLDVLLALRPAAKHRRGTTSSRLEDSALDSLPLPSARGADPGHHAHAVSLPHEAQSVGVCRFGGRDPLECRSGVYERNVTSSTEGTFHSRSQS